MIYINPNSSEIIKARDIHYKYLHGRIKRKLGENTSKISNGYFLNSLPLKFKSTDNIANCIRDFLLEGNNIEVIIKGIPSIIKSKNNEFFERIEYINKEVHDDFQKFIKSKSKTRKDENELGYKLFIDLSRIFDYKWLEGLGNKDGYSLYHLAGSLNRNTCTYCNRIYTNTVTVDNNKVTRPQFDHWFPKSKFPLLALSFYNLIPSCSICNSSIKGDEILDLNHHVHPYVDPNQTDEFKFSYQLNSLINRYNINVVQSSDSSKAVNTMRKMEIDKIYESHQSELDDLIKTKKAYSEDYINKMINLFPGANLSREEVYRLAFGVESKVSDFHKRPLSKFKSDILKELGIID